jgi:hypothetical protein
VHLKTKIVVTRNEDFVFEIGHTKPIQEVGDFMTLAHTGTITSVYKNITTTKNVIISITC